MSFMTSIDPGRKRVTWNRKDRVNLGSATAGRSRRIGILGEKLAEAQLRAHGFTNVKNLNHTLRMHHPGADIYAERGGVGFWISVKARNKYAEDGKLNPRYKIKPDELLFLSGCRNRQPDSVVACITISFVMSDRSTFGGEPSRSYSCYFALLDMKRNGILMSPRHLAMYELLALNEMIPPAEDVSDLENTYERRTPIARPSTARP
jgi:hypothetical protein